MAYINLAQVMYPVGAIYQSSSATSPSSFFGGTWAALNDNRFWLPSNSFGSTGGEWNHILSQEEMPRHYHDVVDNGSGTWANTYLYHTNVNFGNLWTMPASGGTNTLQMSTSSVGGQNVGHNNMPPYRTCYSWRRTA